MTSDPTPELVEAVARAIGLALEKSPELAYGNPNDPPEFWKHYVHVARAALAAVVPPQSPEGAPRVPKGEP